MNNIFHQFQIKSSSKAVFNAFTSPAGLNAWWTLEANGQPELNYCWGQLLNGLRAYVEHGTVIPFDERN